jgi:hypothetical protein
MIETPDGDRYVVLPNGKLAYLGNKQLERSTGLIERTGAPCKIMGKVALFPYLEPGEEDFQPDWDAVQGIERMMLRLPEGCTCGHAAIVAVLTCPVHDVRFSFR